MRVNKRDFFVEHLVPGGGHAVTTTSFTLAGSNLYRRVRHSLLSNNPRRPVSVPTSKCLSEKDRHPTLLRHPETFSRRLRQKPAFARPINDTGRRVAIPEAGGHPGFQPLPVRR